MCKMPRLSRLPACHGRPGGGAACVATAQPLDFAADTHTIRLPLQTSGKGGRVRPAVMTVAVTESDDSGDVTITLKLYRTDMLSCVLEVRQPGGGVTCWWRW